MGALLEFTEAKNISTFIFGTTDTLDYEIGNLVAQKSSMGRWIKTLFVMKIVFLLHSCFEQEIGGAEYRMYLLGTWTK